MGIRKEINDVIVARGGKPPVNGGIAASIDALSKLPPSWNDLTDKPFYEERDESILLSECPIATESIGDHATCLLNSIANNIASGERYDIVFDGKDYSCVAKETQIEGATVIGNAGLSDEYVESYGVEDTGEPFCITRGTKGWIIGTKTAGNYTISVKKVSEIIKTLDPKYLPQGVGGAFVVTLGVDVSTGAPVLTSDKTYSEVVAAVDAGNYVVAKIELVPGSVAWFALEVTDENRVTFSRAFISDGNICVEHLQVYADGRVKYESATVAYDEMTEL